jgi:hypothetical protein
MTLMLYGTFATMQDNIETIRSTLLSHWFLVIHVKLQTCQLLICLVLTCQLLLTKCLPANFLIYHCSLANCLHVNCSLANCLLAD